MQGPNGSSAAVATALWALFVAAVAVLALCGAVPLTYDEAANYSALASHGAAYAVTHYPTPNNHVAFTTLQALLLRPDWVRAWPLTLRVPNLVLVAILLALLTYLLRRHAPLPAPTAVLAAASTLLAAPLLTTYLFVARGYLPGSLLLVGAISAAAVGLHPSISAVLLALAAWAVPTFAYAAPGVLAVGAWTRDEPPERPRGTRRLRYVVIGVAVWGMLILVLYAPVLRELLAQRQGWRSYEPPGHFALGILRRLTNVPGAIAGVVALGAAGLAVFVARRRPEVVRLRLILLMLAACASFVVVAEGLAGAGIAPAPFWRNFLFASLVPPLALSLVLPALPRAARACAWTLLAANAALGVRAIGTAFVAGHPGDYRGFMALSPTPLERALARSEPLVDARCDSLAEPVCRIYAAYLPGLSVGPVEPPPLPCLQGTPRPPEGPGITVTVREGRRRLCF